MAKPQLERKQNATVTIEPTVLNVVTEPEVKVETPEVTVPEVEVAEVEIKAPAKGEKLVKIRTNETFRIFIGDRYYNFKKGEVVSVTENVKDVLMRQGALGAI